MGYSVTVITCFPNFPKGKIFEGYKNKLYDFEKVEGISIIRVWSYISENKGFFRRIVDYSSYAFTSFIAGLFVKTDIIVATSPQFFTAISGRILSFFKNKPWVMEVRDLWPDSIVAVGSINKHSLIYKFLKYLEHQLYQSAFKIVVVSDSFKDYLIKNHNIDKSKIGVFKNGFFKKKQRPNIQEKANELKVQLRLNNKLIISYIGTHGMAHGLKFILDSIQKIDNPNIHFLFIGDGAEKSDLVNYSKTLNRKNFTFLDSVLKENVEYYIQLSDFALVNLKKAEEFKKVIPSKIFENI